LILSAGWSAKGDSLETIKKIVPWEDFRADIEAATEAKPEVNRLGLGIASSSGRQAACVGFERDEMAANVGDRAFTNRGREGRLAVTP
jgi:hypothetical protein